MRVLVSGDSTIAEVVETILSDNPVILESQIDLIAVQHILFGEGFENFDDFKTTADEWLPIMSQDSSEEPLKRFIDSKLNSTRYLNQYRGGILIWLAHRLQIDW